MADTLTYREAIHAGLHDALKADPRVLFMGEDVAAAGGVFKTSEGLLEAFGPARVRDTPISEQAFVGAAFGLALTGYRPIVELMFADFMGVCYDQIVNGIAKHRFMQGGTVSLPLVIRAMGGAGTRFGAQHSQTTEPWLLNVPGLKVWAAASPQQAYLLIRAAVEDPNPVVVLEHKALFMRSGPVERFAGPAPRVAGPLRLRAGGDVTIVASLAMVERALEAADALAADGVEAEVFDVRALRPLRLEPIVESVRRTGRLLVVEENHAPGGWGGEVVATVVREAFDYLDCPPERITLPDWPVPYSPALEDAALPSVEKIHAYAAAMAGDREPDRLSA